jgi:STE24 endopeptidase
MLLYGFLPYLWIKARVILFSLSADLLAWAHPGGVPHGTGQRFESLQTVVFVLLLMGISMISSLPWSLYSTFVIEERHGFNKQTIGLFFSDTVKSICLGLLFIPPVVMGVTYILQVSSEAYLPEF